MSPPRLTAAVVLILLTLLASGAGALEILSKFPVERCDNDSGAGGTLSCGQKLVLDLAIPSDSGGGEASLVVKINETEHNDTKVVQVIKDPPVITINKSAVYAAYELIYLRDVAYKPVEEFVETRKCEPDAGSDVVGSCERLWNESGSIIEHSEPVCCPCGHHRVSTSCGNVFDKTFKGKRNTAHCVRFPGEWFHIFGIGKWSLGFSIGVHIKKSSSVSEVVVGPKNKTVISEDNFLRGNLIGDYTGYTSIAPSLENSYLVTPRKKGATSGQPQAIGNEYSKWMLLDKFHFTNKGLECDKIGVGYEAFQNQPNFCSSSYGSCLNNQLWTFLEGDQIRINKSQKPQFVVEGQFPRINQHPDAGVHSFSIGVTEVPNTNLHVEINADDIEYVYQRSPGKIISIEVPTFEALSQVGTADVTTKNVGKLEASYSLTFNCLSGIDRVEEQSFIMKPNEIITRFFELHTSTDQAGNYTCTAILKASDFSEVDRAGCQVSTTPTVLNNGTQIGPSGEHKKGDTMGFFATIKAYWSWFWDRVFDFFSGRLFRTNCSSFLDLSCHFKYAWIVCIPTVAVLLWLTHRKGYFDPLYDWWEGLFRAEPHDRARMKKKNKKKERDHHWNSHPHSQNAHHRQKRHHIHHHGVLHRHDEEAGGLLRMHNLNPALRAQHRNWKKHGTDNRERRHYYPRSV